MLAEDIQPIRRPTGKAKAKSNIPASAVGSTACPPFDEDQTSEIIDAFPSTQRFAPSKFGVAVCSSKLFRQADQSDINISDLDEPISRPQTPEFLPCKLLGSSSKLLQPSPSSSKKRPIAPDSTIPLSNLPIRSELPSRLDQDLPPANESASTSQSPPKPTKAVAALTYPLSTIPDEYGIPPEDFVDDNDPWRDENDGGDAWLHYDPEVSAGLTTLHTPPSRTPKKPVYAPGERLLEKARLNTKRRGRKAQPSSDQEDGLDWKQRLKNEIINNEAMYLRILRYEPIHFDEFLSLMPERTSGTSRVALRSFLDEQVKIVTLDFCLLQLIER
ncbi:hypothetical protein ONZ45_g12570 [Pleurotus djamor]|nr:hypothetical protein ONZ45_g12570 [Pleurotus djamor]